jgi:uncharacterized protein YkwD
MFGKGIKIKVYSVNYDPQATVKEKLVVEDHYKSGVSSLYGNATSFEERRKFLQKKRINNYLKLLFDNIAKNVSLRLDECRIATFLVKNLKDNMLVEFVDSNKYALKEGSIEILFNIDSLTLLKFWSQDNSINSTAKYLVYPITRYSTFNPSNYNKKLLEDLILEKCNKERDKYNSGHVKANVTCSLAAQHHSDYMLHYNILSHDETFNGFKGQSIKSLNGKKTIDPADRIVHFHSDTLTNSFFAGEICLYNSIHPIGFSYNSLAVQIINIWKCSPRHYKIMLYTGSVASFNVSIGKNRIYATGVFAFIGDKSRSCNNTCVRK